MSVFYLSKNELSFPDPSLADENGLLAIGGDLSVNRLLLAYTHGIFPWFSEEDPILWWCPKERWIIYPEDVHISHSMRKFFKRHETGIVFNRDFADTMHRCRTKREDKDGTWITDEMEQAYLDLHKAGFAMSVESYIDDDRAGGLYGVCIGKCFFGESMYTDIENGSKVALILFAMFLAEKGFGMIDCQLHTDHLESMGAVKISRQKYQKIIDEYCLK